MQAWPNRPVCLIVTYAPGGPTDIRARLQAPTFGYRLAQPILVENVPSAVGNIGMALGAKALPDGHTITLIAPNIVINPSLYAKAGYDPYADFVPVTVAVRTAVLVSVHPSVPVTTLQERIALVKAQPGRHSYVSPGNGTRRTCWPFVEETPKSDALIVHTQHSKNSARVDSRSPT